jgi:CobQ-like glutamine amidotransferase family enzyme
VTDLRIGHLYPDLMSIYGDRGNVLALTQRARWRGIDVETRAFTAGGIWDSDWADVYFFGGGQDLGQDIVGADLQGPNGDALKRSIAGGAAVFSVCGGYQLLGSEYVPEIGDPIPGLM